MNSRANSPEMTSIFILIAKKEFTYHAFLVYGTFCFYQKGKSWEMLNGFQKTDDGLCNGNMGGIELLLTYAEKMQNEEFYFFSKVLVYETAKNIELPDNERFSSDLGLFNGLAGIGYQLLRVSHPNEVPSVMTLNTF